MRGGRGGRNAEQLKTPLACAHPRAPGRIHLPADPRHSRVRPASVPKGSTISDTLIVRALLGAVVAGTVAAAARRAGSLTVGGQWAAFCVGTLVAVAGWKWAALLIGYFVVSSALTRMGRERKAARTASVLPDPAARDATQVLANGGLFAVLVLLGEVFDSTSLDIAGMGALAAAAADTWATEVGTLWGGAPRSVINFAKVEPGVSGGVTVPGTAASVVAAVTMALLAPAFVGSAGAPAVLAAGLAGSVGDSVLGATLQSKRWCEQCRTWTERRVHTCQYRTKHARGLRWMTNDTVNLLATVIGALVAIAFIGARR